MEVLLMNKDNKRILIRDDKQVFNIARRPTIVFNKRTKTLLNIGEYVEMLDYFNKKKEYLLQEGFASEAQSLEFLELEKDQELIDKILNTPDYLSKILTN